MNLLDRVKEMCELKGITIAELERKVDLANGSIRRWDKSYPSADKLQRTANALNTTMDYLLTGKESANKLSAESTILARKANKLSKEQIEVVMGIIEQFNRN